MRHEALVTHMAKTRAALLAEQALVPDALFAERPGDGRWSVAEVLEHLANVEGRVSSLLRDLVEGRRQIKVGLFDRLRRLPPRLIARRRFRLRAPRVVQPLARPPRPEVLRRLEESRTALLALVEENRDRDVSAFLVPHRLLGAHDLRGWAEFIGHHEERHRAQIAEIHAAVRRKGC
jgi:hypothetical protein